MLPFSNRNSSGENTLFSLLQGAFFSNNMSMSLSIVDFPFGDPALDFAPIAAEEGAFFFDSSLFDPNIGRYSFYGDLY